MSVLVSTDLEMLQSLFATIKIIPSPYMVDLVKRTWKERLFSWPWKPQKKYNRVPSEEVYILKRSSDSVIVCHPMTEAKLRRLLNNAKL